MAAIIKLNLRIAKALPVIGWLLALTITGCSSLPRDQHGSSDRITKSGVLVVGVAQREDIPPALAEQERLLIHEVARRLGVKVKWRQGDTHTLLEELKDLKIPLVAAGLPHDTPFADEIGLSLPYLKKGPQNKSYALAVAPGENGLLFLVDQVIAERTRQ